MSHRRSILAGILLASLFALAGCSDDSPPTTPAQQAPTLPDPAQLTFTFGLLDLDPATLDKSADGIHDNFLNAYLRAVLLDAMANLALTPPVAAFAHALHTVPVVQDDGAWIWSYTWDGYRFPIHIALRGMPDGDHVDWEMRVGVDDQEPTALWFAGSTSSLGEQGHWFFHDLDDAAQPINAEIAWGEDDAGRFLQFVSREPPTDGDVLRFNDAGTVFEITFMPAGDEPTWFIRWRADHSGSLQVPDYNGGSEACWDRWLENVDCH